MLYVASLIYNRDMIYVRLQLWLQSHCFTCNNHSHFGPRGCIKEFRRGGWLKSDRGKSLTKKRQKNEVYGWAFLFYPLPFSLYNTTYNCQNVSFLLCFSPCLGICDFFSEGYIFLITFSRSFFLEFWALVCILVMHGQCPHYTWPFN